MRRIVTAVLTGFVAGAVVLGAGGRLVMRIFALATERPPAFTIEGTLSVVLYGGVAGVVGGVLLVALGRLLPSRPLWRGLAFSLLCYVVASPGFRPPEPLVFALFAPFFAIFGFVLVLLERRQVRRRHGVAEEPGSVAA